MTAEKIKCPKENCPGTLQRYRMDLLMSPPIKQYECRYCDKKYKQVDREGEPLTENNCRPYNWKYLVEFYEKQLGVWNDKVG